MRNVRAGNAFGRLDRFGQKRHDLTTPPRQAR
jgi:hypothetical protein